MTTKITEKTNIHIKDLSSDASIKEALNEHISKVIKGIKHYDVEYLKITSHLEIMSAREVTLMLDIEAKSKK